MKKVLHVLSFVLCSVSMMSYAGQVTNLYQADVAADGDASRWQQEALQQILVRVTGKADIVSQPALSAELKQASSYIKQFEAIRHADGNRMRVLLDATKVNQLLQENDIAVWGALRPDILVWLVQQEGGNRSFVRSAEQPLNTAIKQAFAQAALPLLQPLYDMDDLLGLSETDVWAGFWQQINQASVRYRPDVIVVAAVDRIQQDNSQLWRLSWQRQDDGRTFRDEVTADNEAALMQSFAAVLSAQLAERYASVMSAQGNADYVIEVKNLTDLAALVQVQTLLQQVVGVSEATIARYDNSAAYYQLSSNISADGLLNALRFNPRLRVMQNEDTGQSLSVDTLQQPVFASFEYIKP